MRAKIHPAAALEIQEAREWYNKQRPGLGDEFADEVESTIGRICESPNIWPIVDPDVRICRTKRFTYGLVYRVGEDEILVVAVSHLHREPGYWKGRLPDEN